MLGPSCCRQAWKQLARACRHLCANAADAAVFVVCLLARALFAGVSRFMDEQGVGRCCEAGHFSAGRGAPMLGYQGADRNASLSASYVYVLRGFLLLGLA